MSVDAVVSYHGQRAQSTTRSPAHTSHDDDDVRRQRQREHDGTRRTQSVPLLTYHRIDVACCYCENDGEHVIVIHSGHIYVLLICQTL